MKSVTKLWVIFYAMAAVYVFWLDTAPALATPPSSANYQFQETSIGGTGVLNTQSANYQAAGTAGVLGIGSSASTNLQIYAGNNTTGDPALSFTIPTGAVNLGIFSPATTATATTTFEIVNYTSYGYVVQILGTAPSYGSNTIDPMTTTGPSQASQEQFGINLVANTSPISLGANPILGDFGFGSASANYGTPNNYRFVSGETIASAPKSSGKTIYTISYIVNVGSLTPGGQYTANQTVLVIGTY